MRTYSNDDYLTAEELVDIIEKHLIGNISICISRLSDAELGVLYQQETSQHDYNWWRRYCSISGVSLPNIESRNNLIESLRNIDIMGIFTANPDKPEPYLSLHNAMYRDTQRFFDEYNIYPEKVFYCFDHFRIPAINKFSELIKQEPPLLIGNTVKGFADLLKEKLDVDVKGIIPCKDIFDVDNVINKAKKYDYKWAIVSAGTPAKIICSKLTKEYGKITLDLGNVLNAVCDGRYDYCYLNY